MRNAVKGSTRGLIFGTLAVSLLSGPAFAQKPAVIDPKAQEMLKRSAATYAALHSYSCEAKIDKKVSFVPGVEATRIKLALQSPNQAAITLSERGETVQYFTEGNHLFVYSPNTNQFMQEENRMPPGQPKIAPVLNRGAAFAALVLLEPTILTNFASTIDAKSLTLGSVEIYNGIAVRTITEETKRLTSGRTLYQLTIGVKNHLIYRYNYIIQNPKDPAMGVNSQTEIDSSETYTNIQVNPVLPPAMFLPPASAKKITNTETK